MSKGNLRLVSSRAVNGTVPPRRVPNAELRTREYLDEFEVNRLIKAAKANRHGQRDAAMILLRSGMDYGRLSWSICDGIKSISAATHACTSGGSKMGCQACIRYRVTKCGRCGR
jgi:hypothetical protein